MKAPSPWAAIFTVSDKIPRREQKKSITQTHAPSHTRTHMWKTLNRLSAQHQRDGFAVMQRTSRSLLLSWLCINTPLIVYTVLQGFGFQGPSLWARVRSPHTQAHTELQKYGRTCGCAHIHANANQTPRVPAFL